MPVDRSQVDQDHQDPGPLDVAEEPVAEPLALGRPLHQPGDVGHHEVGPRRPTRDHAEVGLEGGERVVGDLGLGRRDPRDQRALAHVGEPHQGHVGHQRQLEVEPVLLALLALLGEGRGPSAVGEEAGVAPPPAPPSPASHRSPGLTRSASRATVGSSARVPTGTGTSRSAPRAPCRFLPRPCPPSPARRWGWSRKPSSDDWLVRPPATRRRRGRRRRRRGRPGPRGPRGGRTPRRRRRRRPSRGSGPRRRTRTLARSYDRTAAGAPDVADRVGLTSTACRSRGPRPRRPRATRPGAA